MARCWGMAPLALLANKVSAAVAKIVFFIFPPDYFFVLPFYAIRFPTNTFVSATSLHFTVCIELLFCFVARVYPLADLG
jgi:hypothetical protein